MNLKKLVALADSAPGCGTRPPRPGPHRLDARFVAGPEPHPWRHSEVELAFWDAVRLYQAGQRLEGIKDSSELGAKVMSTAANYFDDTCGTLPTALLIQWLTHHPPSPPPWLETVIVASVNVEFANAMGGELGKQLNDAAAGFIIANLPQVLHRRSDPMPA